MNRYTMALCTLIIIALAVGCSKKPKVFVATGTIVGLEASPGSTTTPELPSVTFGYKRAEVALVPVDKESTGGSIDPPDTQSDAYSVLAVFKAAINWFGPAKIEQFLATGIAAQTIAQPTSTFSKALAQRTEASLSAILHAERKASTTCWKAIEKWMKSNEIAQETLFNTPSEDVRRKAIKDNERDCLDLSKSLPKGN